MHIDRMRFIDRWLGIPACLVLSLLRKASGVFSGRRTRGKPQKILFLELSEMGSMVLAYPMLRRIAERYPEADLYFLTFRENRYAVDILNVIPENCVLTLDPSRFSRLILSTLAALRRIRKLGVDTVVDMESFARFTAVLSGLSGARIRIGFHGYTIEGLYRGDLLTHRVAYNPHVHMSHNFLSLARSLDAPPDEIPPAKRPAAEDPIELPRFEPSHKTVEAVRGMISDAFPQPLDELRLVLLNPNAGDIIPLRRWPLENYTELGRLLLKDPGVRLIVTGIAKEFSEARSICSSLGESRCLNLAGKTSFPELLALYRAADLLITNDSGPAHFAALTDISVLVLFGPETPTLYGPLTANSRVLYRHFSCSPCVSVFNHRRSPCRNNVCLQDITPRQVYDQARSLLRARIVGSG